MKFAVIQTGGKQYLAVPGEKVEIEKLSGAASDVVSFDEVLFVYDNGSMKIGNPTVSGASVKGKILDQIKADKIVVFKYRAKSRYRRKTGHRQKLTLVQIEEVK
jgi:large subunit ribosomal protein L21